MACFERIDIPTLIRTRREAVIAGRKVEPVPRDDVGVVVRDLGPGTWRGVLVRKWVNGRGRVLQGCLYAASERTREGLQSACLCQQPT